MNQSKGKQDQKRELACFVVIVNYKFNMTNKIVESSGNYKLFSIWNDTMINMKVKMNVNSVSLRTIEIP